jgi:hypothetical protein
MPLPTGRYLTASGHKIRLMSIKEMEPLRAKTAAESANGHVWETFENSQPSVRQAGGDLPKHRTGVGLSRARPVAIIATFDFVHGTPQVRCGQHLTGSYHNGGIGSEEDTSPFLDQLGIGDLQVSLHRPGHGGIGDCPGLSPRRTGQPRPPAPPDFGSARCMMRKFRAGGPAHA